MCKVVFLWAKERILFLLKKEKQGTTSMNLLMKDLLPI